MILFSGDLFLGNYSIKISNELHNKLKPYELIITNFENVLQNKSLDFRADKVSNLQFSKTGFFNYIKTIGKKNLFTLGNNHINDLGQKGIIDTISFLKENNIDFCGAGLIDKVLEPYIFTYKKRK